MRARLIPRVCAALFSMPKEAKTKAPKEPKAAKAPKEKKEKKEKTGPKRALSAYMYFASAKRSEVKASNPGACAASAPIPPPAILSHM